MTWRIHPRARDLKPEERDIAFESLRYHDGTRYLLTACVVMNDHVHALVEPLKGYDLDKIIHTWKSYPVRVMQTRGLRRGEVWQDEAMDRVMRSTRELLKTARYIVDNPSDRWEGIVEYRWSFLARVPTADGCLPPKEELI